MIGREGSPRAGLIRKGQVYCYLIAETRWSAMGMNGRPCTGTQRLLSRLKATFAGWFRSDSLAPIPADPGTTIVRLKSTRSRPSLPRQRMVRSAG